MAGPVNRRTAAREAPRTHDIAVLVNAGDRTVKTSATDALSRNWSTHGASVSVFELPDSLRLPHHIIDPLRGRAVGESVLAMIRDLAYGQSQTALAPRISPHDE